MSKTNKSAMVQVSITTFDRGDETIVVRAFPDRIEIKEHGKRAELIELEAAVKRMAEMELGGWGVTRQVKMMPAWAM